MSIPSLLERVKSALLSQLDSLLIDLEPKRQSGELTCWCPFHGDRENARSDPGGSHRPNLSVNPTTGVWHCFKCKRNGNLLGLAVKLWLDLDSPGKGKEFGQSLQQLAERLGVTSGVTIAQYASFLGLPVQELASWGVRDCTYRGTSAVAFPHLDANGQQLTETYRVVLRATKGTDKIRAKGKTPRALYGLDRLPDDPATPVIMPEGESDCHVLWHCGFAALGVPGVTNFRKAFHQSKARVLRLERLYVVAEPDAEHNMPADVAAVLAAEDWKGKVYSLATPDTKDPRALWEDCNHDVEQFQCAMAGAMNLAVEITPPTPQPKPSPVTTSLAMGTWEISESAMGYFMRSLAKDDSQPFQVTNWTLERKVIWLPEVPDTPAWMDALIRCGEREFPVLWATDVLSDSRRFLRELLRACPAAVWSSQHVGAILGAIPGLRECPIQHGASGPGYHDGVYVMPSVYISQGRVLPNRGEFAMREEDPWVLHFDLALPPDDAKGRADCLAALDLFLELHEPSVMLPCLAVVASAAVMDRLEAHQWVTYLNGETGSGKTTIARASQGWFSGITPFAPPNESPSLILGCNSTANYLEAQGHKVRNVVVVLDDLKAGLCDMEGIARVIQHIYDATGRGRMTREMALRMGQHMRGQVLLTGEQLPALRGGTAAVIRRGLVVEVGKEGLNHPVAQELGAVMPRLQQMMAAFIAYTQVTDPPAKMPTARSTSEMFCQQAERALTWFLRFCQSWGMPEQKAADLLYFGHTVLAKIVLDSEEEIEEQQDHQLFVQAVSQGLASGRLTLEEPRGAQRRIGFVTGDGMVALFPSETMAVLRDTFSANFTANGMGRSLKRSGKLHIGGDGRPSRKLRFGGNLTDVWVMRVEVVPPPEDMKSPAPKTQNEDDTLKAL